MNNTDWLQISQILHNRQSHIAESWYRSLPSTSFVPLSPAEEYQRFVELTEKVTSLLLAEPFDPQAAQTVGIMMSELRRAQIDALSKTLEILAQQLVVDLSADQVIALRPRLVVLFSGLAAGFLRHTRDTILTEQEEIRAALTTANTRLLVQLQQELAERTRVEEALRESEERFRNIFAESPIGIELYDASGELLLINQACLDMFGVSDFDEIKGFKLLEYAYMRPDVREALQQGKRLRYEAAFDFDLARERNIYTAIKSGVIYLDIQLTPIGLQEKGALIGFLFQMQDITQQKHAQERVRREAARAGALVRVAARLNAQLDVDTVLHAVCEEAARALDVPITSVDLYDPKRQVVELAASYGLPPEYRARIKPTPTTRSYRELAHQGSMEQVMTVSDVRMFPDLPNAEALAALNIRTTATARMLSEGRLIGVLNIATVNQVQHFTDDDLMLLKGLADQAALAIVNAQSLAAAQQELVERKRAEEQLEFSREQLRALSARLQSIREEERSEIALEIHDELGQALTGLKMDLAWLAKRLPAQEQTLLEKTRTMSELIDTTIRTVRRITTELRPSVLDDLGLVATLEWQAKEFQTRTGILCQFTSNLADDGLERDLNTALFRIIQETLTNVMRHADASRVSISLKETKGNIILTVKDDGRGIRQSEINNLGSLGLVGMRERAHVFGGEVKIRGKAGKGTTVTVRIPPAHRPLEVKHDPNIDR